MLAPSQILLQVPYELHIQIQQILQVPHMTFHAIWAFVASGDV